jgi:hypothetical protein
MFVGRTTQFTTSCILCETNIPSHSHAFGLKKSNESWLFVCSRKCKSAYNRVDNDSESEFNDSENDSSEKEEEGEHLVHKITDFQGERRGPKSKLKFLVHWVGADEPTWEPWSNLKDTIAIRVFLKNTGMTELLCASDSEESEESSGDDERTQPIDRKSERELEEEEGYLVEKILDYQANLDGPKSKWKILVKWVGYSNADNTWEPFSEFEHSIHLRRFLRARGLTELLCVTTKKESSIRETVPKTLLKRMTPLEKYNTVCEEMEDFIVPDESESTFGKCEGPILHTGFQHASIVDEVVEIPRILETDNEDELQGGPRGRCARAAFTVEDSSDEDDVLFTHKRVRGQATYDKSVVEAVIKELEKRYILVPRKKSKNNNTPAPTNRLFCATCREYIGLDSFSAAQKRETVSNDERVCLKHSSTSAYGATFHSVCREATGLRLK